MNCAVATIWAGAMGESLRSAAYPRHSLYASKCNAAFESFMMAEKPFAELMMYKMKIMDSLLAKYQRVLWVDADVLIHLNSPNLFDIVSPNSFAAVDECACGNDAEVYYRHQHLAKTCLEETMPIPDTKGRYFNCGIFMANQSHRHLFAARKTFSNHNWCEQSLVNARLMLSGDEITSLPECFNRFVYWGQKPRRFEQCSYFLHYAGPASQEQRIIDMKKQSSEWGDL